MSKCPFFRALKGLLARVSLKRDHRYVTSAEQRSLWPPGANTEQRHFEFSFISQNSRFRCFKDITIRQTDWATMLVNSCRSRKSDKVSELARSAPEQDLSEVG